MVDSYTGNWLIWLRASGRVADRNRLAEVMWFEVEAIDRLLATLETGQVSADKGVAQQIADGGQNIRTGGSRKITAKRNQRSELIARLVLENSRGKADQSLPKKLKHGILFDILREAEHFQIAEKRLGIPGKLTFFGISFNDEVQPSSFKIEFPIGPSQIIDFGDVKS